MSGERGRSGSGADLPPPRRARTRRPALALLAGALALLPACGPDPEEPPVQVVVPRGASLQRVADSLASQGIIGARSRPLFVLYARLRRADRDIRAGHYEFRSGETWERILGDLRTGRVITVRLTVPEGFTLSRMVPRLAIVSEVSPDSVEQVLLAADSLAANLQVPGPGLEGYLFPDTYLFEPGSPVEDVLAAMVRRYQAFWIPERRERLAELGMSEREVVTLASIIEAEAVWAREMPVISSVYHNRLRIGQALYADPTVLYALGGHRERLLYAAIDSVADNPYNTYRHPGLPPGPIGSPGEQALEAALYPADTPYFYFVARPDGTHLFTRTVDEHNIARARARREWDTTQATVGVRGAELDSVPAPPTREPPP